MNGFRLAGDLSHLAAIIFLVGRILYSKSVAGISAKTQILYGLVFLARYLDLFWSFISYYNSILKVVFISVTWLTVILICGVYRQSYDRRSDSFRAEFLVIACVPISFLITYEYTAMEVLWAGSICLEALAIIPQLYMISTTGYLEPYLRHYIFTLGLYRLLYILNWTYRFYKWAYFDSVSVIGGCVQVLLYVDFFYLCLTKGEVKATGQNTEVLTDNSLSLKGKLQSTRLSLMSKLKGGQAYQQLPTNEGHPRSQTESDPTTAVPVEDSAKAPLLSV